MGSSRASGLRGWTRGLHIFRGSWSQRGLWPGPARPVPHSGRLSNIQRAVFNQLFHPHSQEKAVKSEAALASALEQNRADIVLARSSRACLVLTPQMVLISSRDLHMAPDLPSLHSRGSNPQT